MDQAKAVELFTIFAGKVPVPMMVLWDGHSDYTVEVHADELDGVALSVLMTTAAQNQVQPRIERGRFVLR